jgi:dihydroneopterin aldolase
MVGTAGLKSLQIDCIVGVYEHERTTPQRVVMDVEMDYDFMAAARSDAIDDAVDYAAVAKSVTELVTHRQFQLIETMAEEAAAMLLATRPQVQVVRLDIRKPAAVPTADCSFVRVERTRS